MPSFTPIYLFLVWMIYVSNATSPAVVKQFHILDNELNKDSSKPSFCHELDCPDFKEIKKTADYEVRQYERTGWVSTSLTGVDYDQASYTMFMRLFNYIQGANKRKEKIAMTAPVITRVAYGPGPACENNFTMSFFMSPSVKDPPAPTDETVFLKSLPSARVYVKSFGGFATKTSWLKNAEELANALVRDKVKFYQDFFYTAGYDSPFKILGRHNEVIWIGN